MSFEEKNAWVYGLVAVLGYGLYLALILGGDGAVPLAARDYRPMMLWSIGGAVVASVLGTIVLSALAGRDGQQRDIRDRQISRFGEHVGQSFVVMGAVSALLMAMAELPLFWIANAVYLCFVLSALLSSIARIAAYRFGFEPW